MKSTLRAFSLNLLLVATLLIATPALVPAPAAQVDLFYVTNTDDTGDGSLRWAIEGANASSGTDTTILFNLTGCPCTITLASTLPEVTDDLTITGPGADQLTISGNNLVRVMEVDSGVSLTLEDLTVANGAHDNLGAGVYTEGPLTITDCAFSGNRTVNPSGDHKGGAIYFNHPTGALTITGSTFANNEAHSLVAAGGAIWGYGTVEITNSTFYNNRTEPTQDWGQGSAIFLFSGSLDMTHCTVYLNTSDADTAAAGAIYVSSGTATLKNTIVANNPGGNCHSLPANAITDGGGNLQFGDATCGATIPVADPDLQPPADNGGSTPTMALPMDSPAVDACACTTVDDDQRGEPRPFDWLSIADDAGSCDVGAFELNGVRAYLPLIIKSTT